MGIRGLRSFVDQNSDLIKQHKLHDTKIIIDGTNFLYFLYQESAMDSENYKYGGDYLTFKDKTVQFVKIFRRCRVEPIFVFDGSADKSLRKMPTILKRIQSRLYNCKVAVKGGSHIGFILPILAQNTLRDVLRELEVKFVQSLYEADNDIAMIANYYQVSVVSNDSDFFIYNLNSGLITLDSIDFANIRQKRDKKSRTSYFYLDCRLFMIDNLLEFFPGLDSKMLPLFSALMGNDYINFDSFKHVVNSLPLVGKQSLKVGSRHRNMIRLLDWMRNKTINEVLAFIVQFIKVEDRLSAIELIKFSQHSYSDHEVIAHLLALIENKEFFSDSVNEKYSQVGLPFWFLDKCYRGEIDPAIMSIIFIKRSINLPQVEDLNLLSSYAPSNYLQQYLFSLTMFDSNSNKLSIYDRKDTNFHKTFIVMKKSSLPITTSAYIGMTKSERQNALLKLIWASPEEYQTLTSEFKQNQVDDPAQLALCLLLIKYWIKRVRSTYRECLMGILACGLYNFFIRSKNNLMGLSDTERAKIESNFDKFEKQPYINHAHLFEVRIIHHYNQLQAIILFFLRILCIAECDLPRITPHYFFQGTSIYNLCVNLYRRPDPLLYVQILFLRESILCKMFNMTFKVIEGPNVLERFSKKKKRRKVPELEEEEKEVADDFTIY